MPNKSGRPPKSAPELRSALLQIRVRQSDRVLFRQAAQGACLDLSSWIRERLIKQARKELKDAG
jgi:uncharacterized protein (DUF1778 family)